MQQGPHTDVLILHEDANLVRHRLRFYRLIVPGMTPQTPVTDNRSIPLPKIIWYIRQDLLFRTLVTFSFFSPLASGFRFPII